MCGICGIFRFDGKEVSPDNMRRMNQLMVHRGPDDEGYYINGEIGLGIRRLAIIDISGGHQPISSEDTRYTVVLNGEIYNYLELKEELVKRGHVFSTSSDTEVIVHLFEEKGPQCVNDLNGMFSFALWDNIQKELFVFRDRIGIKPLFYASDKNSFVFSSDLSCITQLKPAMREIDFNSFLMYLGLSYIPYPETIFKNIYKLEPGHYLKVSKNGSMLNEKYWDIERFETLNLPSLSDYQELVMNLLRDSIRLQMRSDVPVGTFLSGGLDSSCVVALLSGQVNQVKTFSVGFEGGINEMPYARLIAKRFNTDHTELFISPQDVLNALPEIINKMDEPVADSALIPTIMLSRIAADKGVKVILNGTGGDEIFGGYNRYIPQNPMRRLINSMPASIRRLTGSFYKIFDFDKAMGIENPELFFISSISGINFEFSRRLFIDKTHFKALVQNTTDIYRHFVPSNYSNAKIHRLMFLDLKDYLVGDILSLLDKMTMAVSIEGRVPLLDHRLVETCFQIPDSIKFLNGQLKGFFKTILKDMLPDEIINLPKAGFAGPTRHWINNSLKESMHRHLIGSPISFYKEYFDMDAIKHALKDSDKNWRYSTTLFSLYIFCLWYKRHIEGQKIVL